MWFTEKQCDEIHQKNSKRKDYKLNIGGTDERDIEQAIKNSLKQANGGNEMSGKYYGLLEKREVLLSRYSRLIYLLPHIIIIQLYDTCY